MCVRVDFKDASSYWEALFCEHEKISEKAIYLVQFWREQIKKMVFLIHYGALWVSLTHYISVPHFSTFGNTHEKFYIGIIEDMLLGYSIPKRHSASLVLIKNSSGKKNRKSIIVRRLLINKFSLTNIDLCK